jgi:hypothetical protein
MQTQHKVNEQILIKYTSLLSDYLEGIINEVALCEYFASITKKRSNLLNDRFFKEDMGQDEILEYLNYANQKKNRKW